MNIEKLGITPGPWHVDDENEYGDLFIKSRYELNALVIVAELETPLPKPLGHPRAEVEANARLIAAAPEMLGVLIETAEYQELSHGGVDCIIRDAIESATGRTWEEVRSIVYESV